MKNNEKKYKHLTLSDRTEIEECLTKGMTFKDIGKRIAKDQTTVSKEVKRHIVSHSNSFTRDGENCLKLLKAPFVCNGCEKRSSSACHCEKRLYRAKEAQHTYENLLVEAREGIPLNKESFYETDRVLTDAVKRGQHIYHAVKTYKLSVSKSTVYRHVRKGYYSFTALDLPRAVKFKPRREHKSEFVPKWVKEGRTYDTFCDYIERNDITAYVEMDTVIGRIGGKTIMTLHFTAFNFMLGILLENKTAAEVSEKLIALKKRLSCAGFAFGDIFPLILTDNGGEFSDVPTIETSLNGSRETRVFFCEPNASYEKPRVEKNHTLLRDIVSKGTSFDSFTQDTVNLIFSHMNSVKRANFNGRSAYELFAFAYSEELASALGIVRIAPENVIQSPKLLK